MDVASDILSKNPAFRHTSTLSVQQSLSTTATFALETSNHQEAEIGLSGHISLGTIIIVVAIVRVIEVSPNFNHVDPLWFFLWSIIEASVGKYYLS